MQPAVSQICSLHSAFEQDIAEYAAGACRTIELWLGKLETYLEAHSVADARALLAEHNVSAPVASFQGGLLESQGERRREHWDHLERRLALLRELGVGTIVVALDIAGPLDQQTLDRAQVSLTQLAQQAGAAGLRAALEFQSRSALGNNLQTAVALVNDCGSPHLGICLDAFHFFTGPSKTEDLAYLSPANLFHVQLCDLTGQARELATDADRVLPGDGDFMLTPLIDALRTMDYRGAVSVELMNPEIWRIPPRQFGEIAITALRRVLGQASMGG